LTPIISATAFGPRIAADPLHRFWNMPAPVMSSWAGIYVKAAASHIDLLLSSSNQAFKCIF
jgi:hypothetical protein